MESVKQLLKSISFSEKVTARKIKRIVIGLLQIVLTAFLYIYLFGYYYGWSDHNEQLPIIMRILDPTYLQNDFFVNATSGFSVRYYFSLLMAGIASILSLEEAYFLVYLISLCLFIFGVYRLSFCLFRNRTASYVAVFLILCLPGYVLGGNKNWYNLLIPASIAMPLAVTAIYLFLSERKALAFMLLGVASLFHFTIGFEIAAILTICSLINFRHIQWKSFVLSIVVFSILFLFTLVPLILERVGSRASLSNAEFVALYGSLRHPHHIMPFTWNIEEYVSFFSLTLLFAFAWLSTKSNSELADEKHKTMVSFICCILFCCILGVVFVEIKPLAVVASLQFFRLTTFVKIIFLLYIANSFTLFLRGPKSLKILLGLFGLLLIHNYATLSAFLFLLMFFMLINASREGKRLLFRKRKLLYGIGILCCVIGLFFVKTRWFHYLIILGVFLGSIRLLKIWPRYLTIGLSVVGIIFSVLLFSPNIRKHIIPHYINCFKSKCYGAEFRDVEELARWCKTNTPKDAIFITPPNIENFRLQSERAIVVDFKAFSYSVDSQVEWEKRLNELTNHQIIDEVNYKKLELGYSSLSEKDIRWLSKKYAASFIVVKNRKLNFQLLYQKGNYLLYHIP